MINIKYQRFVDLHAINSYQYVKYIRMYPSLIVSL